MFYLIYKNENESSFKAITTYKKENNIRKIGHTGTLDPLAQGLLLVATGEYTKLISLIEDKTKEYIVEMKLGYYSYTYDAEGPIVFYNDQIPSENKVIQVINSFIGKINQVPPIFSAKKINGKSAYKYARNNQEIVLKPIEVEIFTIKNIKYNYPFISFKTIVSNGTYIRSLVNDIGEKLETKAYMTYLERTMVNGIRQNEKINIEKLLNCQILNLKSNQINDILNNKFNFNIFKDGKYILKLKEIIIGYFITKDSKKEKLKIFGNQLKLIK